jgi:hypothetical protein
MAAFLLSTWNGDRTAASFVETSNPPHQRGDGMAALAAPALRQSAHRASRIVALSSPANPQKGDKANGKFPVETIVWRN